MVALALGARTHQGEAMKESHVYWVKELEGRIARLEWQVNWLVAAVLLQLAICVGIYLVRR